jgi:hypothetical protein
MGPKTNPKLDSAESEVKCQKSNFEGQQLNIRTLF